MPIPPEKQDEIGAAIRKQGFRSCPSCGFTGKFLFGDVATLPVEFVGPNTISGKGVLPIACPRCGYVMLFDTTVLPLDPAE